jgi:hypothetical protein
MEPEGSLPHSQVPATRPFSWPVFSYIEDYFKISMNFHLTAVGLTNLEKLQNDSFVFLRIYVHKTKDREDCINSSKLF